MDRSVATPTSPPTHGPTLSSGQPVAVRLLGPVQALVDGVPVPLSSPKLRRLFAVLALSHNRVVSSARLIDQLWGDATPESAVSALQVYVSRLRSALLDSSPEAAVRLGRQAPGYVLSVPEDAIDARRFDRLVEGARQQVHVDAPRALQLLDQALALVSGEPLADVFDEVDPLAADAQRLRELVLAAQELRVEALLGDGRAAEASLTAGALVAAHPSRETAQALHVLALYRCGRSADALEAYEKFRRRLVDALGADPGPELRRLHSRILQQDPDLDGAAARPTGPIGRDARSQPAVTGPVPVTGPLVGRQSVLVRIDQALSQLADGAGGVWTLSGESGIGKTRLADELSRRARHAGSGVVWGRGQEGAGDAPYRPWSQVLRALPDTAASAPVRVLLGDGPPQVGPPDPSARRQLHDAVAAALVQESLRRPLVLVLEDVQWSDELSLELLLTLARLVPGAPLLLALTMRHDHQSPVALLQLMSQLARLPASHQVRLSGLPPEEAADLVAALAGLPSGSRPEWLTRAVARADGNPFFLTELTRWVQDQGAQPGAGPPGLPLNIRDVLLHRLSGVSGDARELLDLAAVIGRRARWGLLEQVLTWPPERLDRALTEVTGAGLVSEELLPELSVRFSHALVRELLLEELRPTVRARRHAEVGLALVSRPGRVDSESVLAHLSAGASAVSTALLLSALLDAARQASAQTAYEHANGCCAGHSSSRRSCRRGWSVTLSSSGSRPGWAARSPASRGWRHPRPKRHSPGRMRSLGAHDPTSRRSGRSTTTCPG